MPVHAPTPEPSAAAVPVTCSALNLEGDFAPIDLTGGGNVDASCPVKVVQMRWHFRSAADNSVVLAQQSLWGVSGGVVTARQPANGTLLTPGDVISVGYSLKLPDNAAQFTVTVTNAQLSFADIQCDGADHPRAAGFAAAVPDQTFSISSEQWFPAEASDQHSTWEGEVQVPPMCGNKLLRVAGQITFSARVKTCPGQVNGSDALSAVVQSVPPQIPTAVLVSLPSIVSTSPPSRHPLLVPSRTPARFPTIAPAADRYPLRRGITFTVPSAVPSALERPSASVQRSAPSLQPSLAYTGARGAFLAPSFPEASDGANKTPLLDSKMHASSPSEGVPLAPAEGQDGESNLLKTHAEAGEASVILREAKSSMQSREEWLLSRTIGTAEDSDFAQGRAGFLVPSLGLCAVVLLCYVALRGKYQRDGQASAHRLKDVKVQRLVNHRHKDELHKR
jgi:hypothetical protein